MVDLLQQGTALMSNLGLTEAVQVLAVLAILATLVALILDHGIAWLLLPIAGIVALPEIMADPTNARLYVDPACYIIIGILVLRAWSHPSNQFIHTADSWDIAAALVLALVGSVVGLYVEDAINLSLASLVLAVLSISAVLALIGFSNRVKEAWLAAIPLCIALSLLPDWIHPELGYILGVLGVLLSCYGYYRWRREAHYLAFIEDLEAKSVKRDSQDAE